MKHLTKHRQLLSWNQIQVATMAVTSSCMLSWIKLDITNNKEEKLSTRRWKKDSPPSSISNDSKVDSHSTIRLSGRIRGLYFSARIREAALDAITTYLWPRRWIRVTTLTSANWEATLLDRSISYTIMASSLLIAWIDLTLESAWPTLNIKATF